MEGNAQGDVGGELGPAVAGHVGVRALAMFGGTWETIPKPNVTSCCAGTGACAAGRLSRWALALPSGRLRAKLEPDGNAEAHYHQLQCWISKCGEVLRYSDGVIKMGSACEKKTGSGWWFWCSSA